MPLSMKTVTRMVKFVLLITSGFILFYLLRPASTNNHSESSKSSVMYPRSEFESYFETVKQENGTAAFINLAKYIQRKFGLVMVSMINDAFLPFTFSWMCNTQGMTIHEQIIYITTDSQSMKELDAHWTKSHSIYIPYLNLHGDQEYSKVGYVKMMNFRTQLIRLMLLHNITVFLFETDCVWLSNPMSEIRSNLKPYDMLLVQPTHGKGVLGGFMVLKPTKATLSLWSNLSLQMWELLMKIKSLPENKEISKIENDQVYFSKLIKDKYVNINVGFLSNKKFSDGKWYDYPADQKNVPLVLNNNWISGNQKKIERAKAWGHWFLKIDSRTCDTAQVSKIINN